MSRESTLKCLSHSATAYCLLSLPLLVFLKHHGYPLASVEILGLAGVGLIPAILLGAGMTWGRAPGLAIGCALLLVFVIDLQTEWIVHHHWLAWALGAIVAALGWFLRAHFGRIVLAASALMFLSTLLLPGGQPIVRVGDPAQETGNRSRLPFVLHLILDEHIGIEGIPAEFDPGSEIADQMRGFYEENSFRIYSRAYSRYYNTNESISNLLNFSRHETAAHYFGGHFEEGVLLSQNAWFDALHEAGYGIHTVQSDYLRYFVRPDGDHPGGDTCVAYTSEAIRPVASAPLTAAQKLPLILGPFFKLKHHLKWMDDFYRATRAAGMGRALDLPTLEKLKRTRVSPLSSWEMLDELKQVVAGARRGQAVFAHLLLPHYPYAYEANCRLKPRSVDWLEASEPSLYPHRNDAVSRALRYPRYLDQMLCVQEQLGQLFAGLKARGLWDDAVIVIHGDHGSRLDQGPPKPGTIEQMSAADFVDAYSTLFVVTRPDLEAGVDRSLLPIDHLFHRLLNDRTDPGQSDLEASPYVLVPGSNGQLQRRPLPPFADDAPELPRETRAH